MFELSKNISINLEIFYNSKIYIIDNFYQNPDVILNFFLNQTPELFKINETPTNNSIYFEDRRHNLFSDELEKVYDFLSFLCDQDAFQKKSTITTNAIRFYNNTFNDYKNNYWWPHKDCGYTGIVYFNYLDEVSGTNLYKNLDPMNEPPKCPEHFSPWRDKNKYKLIKTLFPKYNRLVLFDAKKFWHGMNICNDDYFGENYRFNQVFFFLNNTHKILNKWKPNTLILISMQSL